jgi:hypothetical protein
VEGLKAELEALERAYASYHAAQDLYQQNLIVLEGEEDTTALQDENERQLCETISEVAKARDEGEAYAQLRAEAAADLAGEGSTADASSSVGNRAARGPSAIVDDDEEDGEGSDRESVGSDDEDDPAVEDPVPGPSSRPAAARPAASSSVSAPRTRKSSKSTTSVPPVDSPSSKPKMSMFQLPKMGGFTFDGDILQYHKFIVNFHEEVDYMDVPDRVKLSLLYKALSGDPKVAIDLCLLNGSAGYKEALDILEDRYGDKYQVADCVLERLADGKPARTAREILRVADELAGAHRVLKRVGMTSQLHDHRFTRDILKRLPEGIQERWRYVVTQCKEDARGYPSIADLIKFVKTAAEELRDPNYGESLVRASKPRNSTSSAGAPAKEILSKERHVRSFSATVPEADNAKKVSVRPPCPLCKANHGVLVCPEFKSKKLSDRWEVVKSQKLCVNCLRPEHVVSACKSAHVCTVDNCGSKHSNFLHCRIETVTSNVISASTGAHGSGAQGSSESSEEPSTERFLPCVTVRINGICTVNALLDPGSSSSFCDSALVEHLGLEGLAGVGEVRHTELVDFDVVSKDFAECMPFKNVYVVDSIPVECPDFSALKYNHLRGIELCGKHNVQLLIGQISLRPSYHWKPVGGARGNLLRSGLSLVGSSMDPVSLPMSRVKK